MTLPFRRLLNLIYHHWIRGADAKSRAEVDASLDNAADVYDDRVTPRHLAAVGPVSGHVPGLAPRNIRPPSWWRGDRGAWSTSVQAARDLDEPAAALADMPTIGSR